MKFFLFVLLNLIKESIYIEIRVCVGIRLLNSIFLKVKIVNMVRNQLIIF